MKIIVAPNALKGSLSATDAASAMSDGIAKVSKEITVVKKPVADGGDGILDVLVDFYQGSKVEVYVNDPLGRSIVASYGIIKSQNTAVVEMASASGLALLKDNELNPLEASTYGTGQLLNAALNDGYERIILGIGGSATNDGGMGLACALGYKFYDKAGELLKPSGINLQYIDKIDSSDFGKKELSVDVAVICDVDNLLLGENGATFTYGKQKGADAEALNVLEKGMRNLSEIIKRDIGVDVTQIKGGGAAGGLGAGLCAFVEGHLEKGVDVVLDLIEIDEEMQDASLVLTSEGQIDNQTAYGKAPAGVAERAKRKNVPCVAIAGGVSKNISELYQGGINAVFSLCREPVSLKQAMENSKELLMHTTEQVVRLFLAGRE